MTKKLQKQKRKSSEQEDAVDSIEILNTEMDEGRKLKKSSKKRKMSVSSNDTEMKENKAEGGDTSEEKQISSPEKKSSVKKKSKKKSENKSEKSQELSAESAEVRQSASFPDPDKEKLKKLKKDKMKMKKLKKQQEKLQQQEAKKEGPSKSELALQYLTCWSKDRQNWNFQKVRQVWLLQNMYNVDQVPEEHFTVLLDYLDGLKGKAREMTVEAAEKMLAEAEDEDSEDEKTTDKEVEEKESKDLSEDQIERVRRVIQILS